MRYTLVATLLVLTLVSPVAAAPGNSTDACDGSYNNTTIRELCENLTTLQQTNGDLRGKVDTVNQELGTLDGLPNSTLQKIRNQPTLNSKLVRLNSYLKHSATSPESGYRGMGAIHPETGKVAFVYVKLENPNAIEEKQTYTIYEFVGKNRGDHSFNGLNAWDKVTKQDTSGDTGVKLVFSYAPPGVNKTQYISDTAEFEALEGKFNKKSTIFAYNQWNRKTAMNTQDTSTKTWITVGSIGLFLAVGLAYVESHVHFFYGRRKNRERSAAIQQSATAVNLTLKEKTKVKLSNLPVVSRIIEFLRGDDK